MLRMNAIFALFMVTILEEGSNLSLAALSRDASEGGFDWR